MTEIGNELQNLRLEVNTLKAKADEIETLWSKLANINKNIRFLQKEIALKVTIRIWEAMATWLACSWATNMPGLWFESSPCVL